MRQTLVFLGVVGVFSLGRTAVTYGHQAEHLSIDTLTRRASVIVEGKVTAVTSQWNAAQTQIRTTVTLEVAKYHKGGGMAAGGIPAEKKDADGNAVAETLDITYLGGTVGNMTMAVLGQAGFVVNEQVIVFLKPNFDQRDIPFVGADEGKFTVTVDPQTGVEHLENKHTRVAKQSVMATVDRIMAPIRAASIEANGRVTDER